MKKIKEKMQLYREGMGLLLSSPYYWRYSPIEKAFIFVKNAEPVFLSNVKGGDFFICKHKNKWYIFDGYTGCSIRFGYTPEEAIDAAMEALYDVRDEIVKIIIKSLMGEINGGLSPRYKLIDKGELPIKNVVITKPDHY